MPRFLKTEEASMDGKSVVLGLMRTEDGTIVGRIVAMTVSHAGLVPTSTAPEDPPIGDAIREAVELATSAESDISVLDPEGLWQPSWGDLETR